MCPARHVCSVKVLFTPIVIWPWVTHRKDLIININPMYYAGYRCTHLVEIKYFHHRNNLSDWSEIQTSDILFYLVLITILCFVLLCTFKTVHLLHLHSTIECTFSIHSKYLWAEKFPFSSLLQLLVPRSTIIFIFYICNDRML